MADAVTTQVIEDGIKYAILKFTNISDGASGESAVDKVVPANLSKDGLGNPCTGVVVEKIWYETAVYGVDIFWDATADVPIFTIPKDHTNIQDFSEFGGIWNNAGAGKTGKIQFSTVGTPAAAARYTVIMKMRKVY